MCVYVYIYTYVCLIVRVYMRVYAHTRTDSASALERCMWMHVYLYICVLNCACAHARIHPHTCSSNVLESAACGCMFIPVEPHTKLCMWLLFSGDTRVSVWCVVLVPITGMDTRYGCQSISLSLHPVLVWITEGQRDRTIVPITHTLLTPLLVCVSHGHVCV